MSTQGRPATIEDYVWLYENTDYMQNHRLHEDAMPLVRAAIDRWKEKEQYIWILDIGSGNGHFHNQIMNDPAYANVRVVNADPAIHEYGNLPQALLKVQEFNLITAFDVLEHLTEEDVCETFRLLNNMPQDAIFTICTESDIVPIEGELVQLHLCIKPCEWWQETANSLCPSKTWTIHPCKLKSRWTLEGISK